MWFSKPLSRRISPDTASALHFPGIPSRTPHPPCPSRASLPGHPAPQDCSLSFYGIGICLPVQGNQPLHIHPLQYLHLSVIAAAPTVIPFVMGKVPS